MNANSVRLRWIYGACYEIVLPNNKVIITDPFVTPDKIEGFCLDDFTGADYILCTHTHYDHTADIGALIQKYRRVNDQRQALSKTSLEQPKLIAGEMSIQALCDFFDLDYFHAYPIVSNETIEFPDFTLQAFRAKHVGNPRGHSLPSKAPDTSVERYGVKGHGECDKLGWLEEYDYVITTNNNFRLMIVAGIPAYSNIYHAAREQRPNVVIRQFFGQPEEYAAVLEPFHAQLYLPNHHEHLCDFFGIKAEDYISETAQILKEKDPYSAVINPEPYRWYQISLSIEQEEKQ